jgi:hypothetical protein
MAARKRFPANTLGFTILLIMFSSCNNTDSGVRGASPETRADASAAASDERNNVFTGKGPRLVFAKTLHDFGRRMSGNNLETTFTFTNMGDAPLLIEHVRSG